VQMYGRSCTTDVWYIMYHRCMIHHVPQMFGTWCTTNYIMYRRLHQKYVPPNYIVYRRCMVHHVPQTTSCTADYIRSMYRKLRHVAQMYGTSCTICVWFMCMGEYCNMRWTCPHILYLFHQDWSFSFTRKIGHSVCWWVICIVSEYKSSKLIIWNSLLNRHCSV
jgi:hypothetical protein